MYLEHKQVRQVSTKGDGACGVYAIARAARWSTVRVDKFGNIHIPRIDVAVFKRMGADLMLSFFTNWAVEDLDELQCQLEPFSGPQMDSINERLSLFNMDVISSKDLDFVSDLYVQLAKMASPYETMDVAMLLMIGLLFGLMVDAYLQCAGTARYQSMNTVGFGCYHGWNLPGLERRVSVLYTNSKIRIGSAGIWEHWQGSKDKNTNISWVQPGTALTTDHLTRVGFLNHFVLLSADLLPSPGLPIVRPTSRKDQPASGQLSSSAGIPSPMQLEQSPLSRAARQAAPLSSSAGIPSPMQLDQSPLSRAARQAALGRSKKKEKLAISQKQVETNRLKQITPESKLLKQQESLAAVAALAVRKESPPAECFRPGKG